MDIVVADIEWRDGVEEAWSDLVGFAPRLIAAIAVLLAGWFIATLLRRVLQRVLDRVRFPELMERSGLQAPLARVGLKEPSRLLATVIYWAAMLLVLQLAIDTFGESAIQEALDDLVGFLPSLFIAIVIVVVTGAIASRVAELVNSTLSEQSYGRTMSRIAGGAIWVVGLFAALNQIEIAEDILTVLFIAVVGTVGLVIVVMFGVSGIQSARDRFWPNVFEFFSQSDKAEQEQPQHGQ